MEKYYHVFLFVLHIFRPSLHGALVSNDTYIYEKTSGQLVS